MIFYGQNVAAFKCNIDIPMGKLLKDLKTLTQYDLFLPHNLQASSGDWTTAPIHAPFGNYRLSDPIFYRDYPPIRATSELSNRDARRIYLQYWMYTELGYHCKNTVRFVESLRGLGSGMTTVRYLQMAGQSIIQTHCDNNPFKEFKITIGLKGIEQEKFLIDVGNELVRLDMKEGEAWFLDVGLKHLVVNDGDQTRSRLAIGYYSPTTDALMELYNQADASDIVYAKQYQIGAPWDDR